MFLKAITSHRESMTLGMESGPLTEMECKLTLGLIFTIHGPMSGSEGHSSIYRQQQIAMEQNVWVRTSFHSSFLKDTAWKSESMI